MIRGYILNIFDSLNLDIGFEDLPELTGIPHDKMYTYTTGEELSVKTGKSYRCHIKDLRFRNNHRVHPDFNISKKVLMQWSDYSDGHVLCKIHNIDTFNRLIVELFDPFTLESYKNYLIQNFKTIFCVYNEYNTPTIRIDESAANRMIPRPKSFQLPDFSYQY
jgi:hypothetical protein